MFVANDQMALGILQALHNVGARVPQDISVVGFDDIPECAFFQPSLTTVRLDFNEVGRRCVARLLDLMSDAPLPPNPTLQPALVTRASTASPPKLR